MVVFLGVSRGREMSFDPEFDTEFSVPGIIKLFVVVGDDHSGNPEPAYDRFLGEVTNVFLSDCRTGFSFHPLCEVVNGYYQEPHLSFSLREGA